MGSKVSLQGACTRCSPASAASGALAASPDFSQYQYCWLRDGSFIAYALDRAGEEDASARFHLWCANSIDSIAPMMNAAIERARLGKPIDPNEMPPARFSFEGLVVKDDWPNFQIDGYGTWLWSLHEHLKRSCAGAPPERAGSSRRTCSSLSSRDRHGALLRRLGGERGLGPHCDARVRIRRARRSLGDARRPGVCATEPKRCALPCSSKLAATGRFQKSNDDPQVDAALLWLCEPFRLATDLSRPSSETAGEVSTELELDGGIRRYPADTYFGGGAWPVLTASLGWYLASTGDLDEASRRRNWIAERFDSEGRLGEQFGGAHRDPAKYSEWVGRWGLPARDLAWSHAMFVVLCTRSTRRELGQEGSDRSRLVLH